MASKVQRVTLDGFAAESSEDCARGKLTINGTKGEVIETVFPVTELNKIAEALSEAAARCPDSDVK